MFCGQTPELLLVLKGTWWYFLPKDLTQTVLKIQVLELFRADKAEAVLHVDGVHSMWPWL